MSSPVSSRRSFLQLAGTGLALSGIGLAPASAAPAATSSVVLPTRAALAGSVLLNFNESPYGPAPAAQAAARDIVAGSGRYLFALAGELRDTFARQEGVDKDRVRLFPGSSEPLNRAAVVWTSPTAGLVVADPTFESLGDLAAARGATVAKVPLRADGGHDVHAMVEAAQRMGAGLLYLCNPNNPTGSITPAADIAWLLAHKPKQTRLLVDEAYLQFSAQPSVIAQVMQRDDVIVLRTFSKLYGMAGLRLGVAAAHPDRLRELASLGDNPLPVTALAAGLASLREPGLVAQRREQNTRVRQATVAWLEARGFRCLPSEANCFMVDVQRDGSAFTKAMAERGVVIGRSWPIWPQVVRVSVGTEAEMAAFRTAFENVVAADR